MQGKRTRGLVSQEPYTLWKRFLCLQNRFVYRTDNSKPDPEHKRCSVCLLFFCFSSLSGCFMVAACRRRKQTDAEDVAFSYFGFEQSTMAL